MKTIERPPVVDKTDWRYLSIKTGAVKAFTRDAPDGSKRYLIEGTASSSVEDLYGDTLTERCQASMLAQANGLTMWLNHSYDVPEDIAGTCIEPQLQNAAAEDGTRCIDLKITLEIDPENPRAFKSWQHVNRGTKLAFSIGGFFIDYELVFEDEDDWWGHFIVDDVLLLEISLVGIPANPRAYTKTFENARAAVVSKAEEIVRAARDEPLAERRLMIRKSFGLAPREEPIVVKTCAHKDGCTEPKADDSLLCVKHRDEVPIVKTCTTEGCTEAVAEGKETCETHASAPEPPVRTVKAVDDENTQGQIVECMKCIQRCVNSPGHALCAEPETHARTAHAILKAMLPDDYGLPEDAQLAAGDPTNAYVRVTLQAGDRSITISASSPEEAQALVAALDDAITLSAENETLKQEIATLKATPTGRSTLSTAGGSTKGSEPTVSPALYYRNRTQLSHEGARKMDGGGADARQSVQV